MISACARARPPRWREALALLDEMRQPPPPLQDDDDEEAAAATGAFPSPKHNSPFESTAAAAAAAAVVAARNGNGNGNAPPYGLQQLLAPVNPHETPLYLPDTVCYNAAMSALARAGRWQEALALLVEMRIQFERFGPGGVGITTAAAAHGYGNGNGARGHFRRRGNGGHNGSSSGGPMPPAFDDTCYDVTTFNTVRFEMVSCLSIFS